jgi:hypothetical protein
VEIGGDMGLLNDFFGSPDQTQALGLLGASMMKGRTADGLLAANQFMAGAGERQMKQKLAQMQIDNYASEIEARKLKTVQDQRQQQLISSFFPGMMGGEQGQAPVGGPAIPGAPAPQGGGNNILALSQQLGIPPQAIQADIVFNGGKKISELLADRSKPNWQNVNGNLVNTNAPGFQGGFQPGMSASSDGRVTAWQPDGQGGLVVGAPRGALDTYGAYQRAGERSKAEFDPVTITPPSGRPVMRSRAAVMGEANGVPMAPQMAPQPGMRGAFVGNPDQVAQAIGELRDPQERANAQAAFEAQMRSSGGSLGGIPLQSEAEAAGAKARSEAEARAGVERDTASQKKSVQANDMLDNIRRARNLLTMDPTGSLAGAGVDKVLGFAGMTTPSGNVADALETLSGWLVANVPRMEGPQSNFDVENYRLMAGRIGDRSIPSKARLAALEEVERIQKKYANLANPAQNTPPSNLVPSLPKTAAKGTRARDTVTGEILEFNGMSWVKAK